MMLELKNVTLVVDGSTLIANLSMIAQGGRLLCVTGNAGSGKTMLARAIMGFVPIASGFISIDGELLTPLSLRSFRRMMGYIPAVSAVVESAAVGEGSSPAPFVADLEGVWAPGDATAEATGDTVSRSAKTAPEPFALSVLASKQVIIADDPAPGLLPTLQDMSASGRVVIVMSRRQEYLTAAQQLVTLAPSPQHTAPLETDLF